MQPVDPADTGPTPDPVEASDLKQRTPRVTDRNDQARRALYAASMSVLTAEVALDLRDLHAARLHVRTAAMALARASRVLTEHDEPPAAAVPTTGPAEASPTAQ